MLVLLQFFQKNAHTIVINTFARLLKLPKVTKPLDRAGVGDTIPASGEGV